MQAKNNAVNNDNNDEFKLTPEQLACLKPCEVSKPTDYDNCRAKCLGNATGELVNKTAKCNLDCQKERDAGKCVTDCLAKDDNSKQDSSVGKKDEAKPENGARATSSANVNSMLFPLVTAAALITVM